MFFDDEGRIADGRNRPILLKLTPKFFRLSYGAVYYDQLRRPLLEERQHNAACCATRAKQRHPAPLHQAAEIACDIVGKADAVEVLSDHPIYLGLHRVDGTSEPGELLTLRAIGVGVQLDRLGDVDA